MSKEAFESRVLRTTGLHLRDVPIRAWTRRGNPRLTRLVALEGLTMVYIERGANSTDETKSYRICFQSTMPDSDALSGPVESEEPDHSSPRPGVMPTVALGDRIQWKGRRWIVSSLRGVDHKYETWDPTWIDSWVGYENEFGSVTMTRVLILDQSGEWANPVEI